MARRTSSKTDILAKVPAPGSRAAAAKPAAVKKPATAAPDKPRTPKAGALKAPKNGKTHAPSAKARSRHRRRDFRAFRQGQSASARRTRTFEPVHLLVAVVLSAQATDAGVNKATRRLFALADTPEKMFALGEDQVRDLIKTIGLFRNKAKNVISLSERLIKAFGSEVPQTREELETLPGVGRKTANVVMNSAFGEPTMAVDTHIFRISNRIPLAPGKTVLEVELGLEKIIPQEYMQDAHHWLILHGRYICKALRPECERCLISDLCRWPDKRV